MATPLTALKTTNRKWSTLSPDVTRQIRNFRPIHPTARLIKDIEFARFPEGDPHGAYHPSRLQFTSAGALLCRRLLPGHRHTVLVRRRHYTLSDFGDSEYDRYQIDSDRANGIRLGRAAGTERWGHEA